MFSAFLINLTQRCCQRSLDYTPGPGIYLLHHISLSMGGTWRFITLVTRCRIGVWIIPVISAKVIGAVGQLWSAGYDILSKRFQVVLSWDNFRMSISKEASSGAYLLRTWVDKSLMPGRLLRVASFTRLVKKVRAYSVKVAAPDIEECGEAGSHHLAWLWTRVL